MSLDRLVVQEFIGKCLVDHFFTPSSFDRSWNDDDRQITTVISPTMAKRKVKFELSRDSERRAVFSADEPLVSPEKLFGHSTMIDSRQLNDIGEMMDQLCHGTYFSKEMHVDPMSSHGEHARNHYEQLNDTEMSSLLNSCQSRLDTSVSLDLCFVRRTCRHVTNLVRLFSLPERAHALLRSKSIGSARSDLVRFAAHISRQEFVDANLHMSIMNDDQSVRQCLRSTCLRAVLKHKNIVVLVRNTRLSDQTLEQLFVFTREGTFPGLFSNEELLHVAATLSPGLPTDRHVSKTNSVLNSFFATIRKRIHLVILENSRGHLSSSLFASFTVALVLIVDMRHVGLFSSCYVDQYDRWTRQELISIVKHWMTTTSVTIGSALDCEQNCVETRSSLRDSLVSSLMIGVVCV